MYICLHVRLCLYVYACISISSFFSHPLNFFQYQSGGRMSLELSG